MATSRPKGNEEKNFEKEPRIIKFINEYLSNDQKDNEQLHAYACSAVELFDRLCKKRSTRKLMKFDPKTKEFIYLAVLTYGERKENKDNKKTIEFLREDNEGLPMSPSVKNIKNNLLDKWVVMIEPSNQERATEFQKFLEPSSFTEKQHNNINYVARGIEERGVKNTQNYIALILEAAISKSMANIEEKPEDNNKKAIVKEISKWVKEKNREVAENKGKSYKWKFIICAIAVALAFVGLSIVTGGSFALGATITAIAAKVGISQPKQII